MPKKSVLQFHGYHVEKIRFEHTQMSAAEAQVQIDTTFRQELVELEQDKYDMKFSVIIGAEEEKKAPFSLRIDVVGHFTYQDEEGRVPEETKEALLKRNTVSILFPFVRSLVATVTSNANIPPLLLPVVDFSQM